MNPMAFEQVPSLVFRSCMTIPTSGPSPLSGLSFGVPGCDTQVLNESLWWAQKEGP